MPELPALECWLGCDSVRRRDGMPATVEETLGRGRTSASQGYLTTRSAVESRSDPTKDAQAYAQRKLLGLAEHSQGQLLHAVQLTPAIRRMSRACCKDRGPMSKARLFDRLSGWNPPPKVAHHGYPCRARSTLPTQGIHHGQSQLGRPDRSARQTRRGPDQRQDHRQGAQEGLSRERGIGTPEDPDLPLQSGNEAGVPALL